MPKFRPWYQVLKTGWGLVNRPVQMFPSTQRLVFANAIILTELGFKQHNPAKPHLFRYLIRRKPCIFMYADLGGSDVEKIYEDTAAMLYVPDLSAEPELEQYTIRQFGRKLRGFGVNVKVGFQSRADLERKNVDPIGHVQSKMLNSMIRQTPNERTRPEDSRIEVDPTNRTGG